MKKTTKLKHLINNSKTNFLLEAHNALSAKIVEETGFQGIWASGLSISASLGVRDNNELSWTQVLETVEYMSDATSIPILLDGDTGYGNFNNMQRLVKKLEQRNVAGVCIEDKLFPKANSFLRSEKQPLAAIDEFSGKIKAAKDIQQDDDFVVVARVEAFIAGWGLQEALKRAEAYRQAGADAILIHSKQSTASEIFAFLKEWDRRLPVVIVPTKYYKTPTPAFEKEKVSLIIWANHMLRASLAKMQKVAHTIYHDQAIISTEEEVAPLSEVFRLQGDSELQQAEKLYLSEIHNGYKAILLAATQGKKLGKITEDKPKAMIQMAGKSILETSVNTLQDFGIKDVTVVTGFKPDKVNISGIDTVHNSEYQQSGQVYSLYQAYSQIQGNAVIMFGDIVYRKYILSQLCDDEGDIVIIVDSGESNEKRSVESDFVITTQAYSRIIFDQQVFLQKMVFGKPDPKYHGEWIGFIKLSANGSKNVINYLDTVKNLPNFMQLNLADMLNFFVEQGIKVKVQYISGHWLDVDDVVDLNLINNFS